MTPAWTSRVCAARAALMPAASLSNATMTRRAASGATRSNVANCSAVNAVPNGATATPPAAVTAAASIGPSTMTRSAPAFNLATASGVSPYGNAPFTHRSVVGLFTYFGACTFVSVGDFLPTNPTTPPSTAWIGITMRLMNRSMSLPSRGPVRANPADNNSASVNPAPRRWSTNRVHPAGANPAGVAANPRPSR